MLSKIGRNLNLIGQKDDLCEKGLHNDATLRKRVNILENNQSFDELHYLVITSRPRQYRAIRNRHEQRPRENDGLHDTVSLEA